MNTNDQKMILLLGYIIRLTGKYTVTREATQQDMKQVGATFTYIHQP